MEKVIVTGGAGFIGSHLCERLLSEGYEVACLDNFDDYYDPRIKRANVKGMGKGFRLIKADIRNPKALAKALKATDPDYIVHEAAQAGVRASVDNPLKTNDVNVSGTLNLLEALRDSRVKKTVFASSSSVYGKVEYLPFDEKHPTHPISPYGASKLACEHYFRAYSGLYGMKYVSLRYFTVYGPRMRPDLAIHKFTRQAMTNGELEVYGDGSKSRDFTFVTDAVDATVKAMRKGHGIYNVGGGSTVTVKSLAERIIKEVGSGRIRYVEDQKGDVEHTASETTKARKELGWKPRVPFDDGLPRTVEWIMSNSR